jgi:hypothetical protein
VARARAGRPILEVVVGAVISALGLGALALLVFAVLTGQLAADPQLLVGFAVGGIVVIALIVGAVRLVLLAVATPMRRDADPTGGQPTAGPARNPDV